MAKRAYGYRWQKAREGYLRKHPFCSHCESIGLVVAASVIDHIVAHKGDMELFWDSDNWQSLCKECHDSWKKRLEGSGIQIGCDESGMPIDPSHYWNQ